MHNDEGRPCQLLYYLLRHPNLESLQFKGSRIVWDDEVFSYLVGQSNFCNLEALVFGGTVADHLDVAGLLHDLPNLRELWAPPGTQVDASTLMWWTDRKPWTCLGLLAIGGSRLY
ncbi:hypothetical protein AMATHDRAFT_5599 [Amanita thiersii Skay4041]|uniref:Uncharacterized protein n=1 Tax=Amanita thiersii Skay4041 TaxID=703135 RepID=A0A2A9NDD0_9AGAR|nr:hypothetical protein AMATHDRAFT_5599 [Amanita thiersii Skay4041]